MTSHGFLLPPERAWRQIDGGKNKGRAGGMFLQPRAGRFSVLPVPGIMWPGLLHNLFLCSPSVCGRCQRDLGRTDRKRLLMG